MAKKIINEKSALELFNKISSNNELVLENPRSGCFARTDIMCKIAKDNNIEPMVIRTFSRDIIRAPLFYTNKSENMEKSYATWDFHVAMAINVKNKNGDVTPIVFDPAMYDGPVSISQWKNTLHICEQYKLMPREEGLSLINSDYAKVKVDNASDFMKRVKSNYDGNDYIKVPSVWAKLAREHVSKPNLIQALKSKYISR